MLSAKILMNTQSVRAAVCAVISVLGACASPVIGRLDRTDDQVQAVFATHKEELYRIYAVALAKKPTLHGTMVMRLTVSASGEVTEGIIVSSTMKDREFEEEFLHHVRALDFGATAGGRMTFLYPVTFIRNQVANGGQDKRDTTVEK